MAVIREPTLLLTPDSVGEWLGTKRVSKVAILMDPAIAGSPLVEAIRSAARSAGCSTTEQLLTAPGALSTLKALASRISTSDGIVAIGGSGAGPLPARALALPTLEKWLDRTGRAGWVSLPKPLDPTLRLVAVPTTVGTGAEVNSVACLDAPDGKRLVHGPALCPDAALLDPEATRTLPGQLVQEGVFEALSRAIGPYAGSHDELVFEDGIAESVAETLARLGHRVRDELLADGQVTATTR